MAALRGAVARGVAAIGLVLAGIAPAAALLTVSCEQEASAAVIGGFGLAAAGFVGLRHIVRELLTRVVRQRGRVHAAAGGFALLSMVIAARIWWVVLPMLGGGTL